MTTTLFLGSDHSNLYSKFRPSPPDHLIQYVLNLLPPKRAAASNMRQPRVAADIGCGSGQCTRFLSSHFDKVFGFDVSETQIMEANKINTQSNVEYIVSAAEDLPLNEDSIDLITCCQSFHWFVFESFFKEVRRVLAPNGVLALISYDVPCVLSCNNQSPTTSGVMGKVHEVYRSETLKKYWRQELEMVDSAYAGIDIPLRDVVRKTGFIQEVQVTGSEVVGYIESWSAYQTCLKEDPETAKALIQKFKSDLLLLAEMPEGSTLTDLNFVMQYNFSILYGKK